MQRESFEVFLRGGERGLLSAFMDGGESVGWFAVGICLFVCGEPRGCLKTGDRLDFWTGMRGFKERNRFLTLKAPFLVEIDCVLEFQNKL